MAAIYASGFDINQCPLQFKSKTYIVSPNMDFLLFELSEPSICCILNPSPRSNNLDIWTTSYSRAVAKRPAMQV